MLKKQFRIQGDTAEIAPLQTELAAVLEAGAVNEACDMLLVAVEEILSNTILHGYDDDRERHIELDVVVDESHVELIFADNGKPFDPLTEAADPEEALANGAGAVGGLGVFMARSIADQAEYRREAGRNVLRLVKWRSDESLAD